MACHVVTWNLMSCDSRGLSRSKFLKSLFEGNLINHTMTVIYTRNPFKWLRLTALDFYWFRVKWIDLNLNIHFVNPLSHRVTRFCHLSSIRLQGSPCFGPKLLVQKSARRSSDWTVQFHVLNSLRKCNFGPESYFEYSRKSYIRTIKRTKKALFGPDHVSRSSFGPLSNCSSTQFWSRFEVKL